MFVIDYEYADILKCQKCHRYDLMNDDGTSECCRHIISDDELSFNEIMTKFNESDIWFVAKATDFHPDFQLYVNLVNEMKRTPKYSTLFDEQRGILRKLQSEKHKSEIRAEATIFETHK